MHMTVKPHHFLDYIYEVAANNGKMNPVTPYGSKYGYYGTLIAAGKIDSVSFTTGADDPCQDCCKLVDGLCTDAFTTPESIAFNKGFTCKYDYNLKMDTDLLSALPDVFALGKTRSIDEVYALLKETLTPEIILLTWQRKDRVELTYRGLDMLIAVENNKREKSTRGCFFSFFYHSPGSIFIGVGQGEHRLQKLGISIDSCGGLC